MWTNFSITLSTLQKIFVIQPFLFWIFVQSFYVKLFLLFVLLVIVIKIFCLMYDFVHILLSSKLRVGQRKWMLDGTLICMCVCTHVALPFTICFLIFLTPSTMIYFKDEPTAQCSWPNANGPKSRTVYCIWQTISQILSIEQKEKYFFFQKNKGREKT